jgi:RNA polymerase sigma factor (sigma-70 family)
MQLPAVEPSLSAAIMGNEQLDTLLLPFVRAADNFESERLLSYLITEHAAPIVTKIVNYKIHGSRPAASPGESVTEAEDVCGEVMLQLVQRLRNLRSDYASHPIGNFDSYVAVTTYNACDRHISRKYPQRRRLKNGLRYLLTHRVGLALWQDEQFKWVGGLKHWQTGAPVKRTEAESLAHGKLVATHRSQQLRDDPRAFTRDIEVQPQWNDPKHAYELLSAIFAWTNEPIELDLLTSVVASWWNVTDETIEIDAGSNSDRQTETAGAQVADTRPDAAIETERHIYLNRLWDEISQLPPRQRAALLLNLRDENGRGVVDLWMIVGIATPAAVAAVLEMTVEEFAELWSELPLDDNRIASILGLTRQQVINLRKSARERLTRRMKDF